MAGYVVINLLAFRTILIPFAHYNVDEADIYKETVTALDLLGKKHIICDYTETTGANFLLRVNEYGLPTMRYIQVEGCNIDGTLSYEFLTSGNLFVFYVVDKEKYYSEELGENVVVYYVDGWEVLYPAKHEAPVSNHPKYILKDDLIIS